REMEIWSNLHHDNILPLIGFCFRPIFRKDGSPPKTWEFSLLSPWMDNETVDEYAKDKPTEVRLRLLSDIAKGLEYLHDSRIIHGDLKGLNILVNVEGRALLADFGLSRQVTQSLDRPKDMCNLGAGTTKWLAPELVMHDPPIPSTYSDVWAFGCIIMEIFVNTTPYSNCRYYQAILKKILDKTPPHEGLPEVEQKIRSVPELWELCLKCWEQQPEERPIVSHIIDALK
ncbi:kinase-like protein, partial [Sistotremastrum niveocremeum HHB9708]